MRAEIVRKIEIVIWALFALGAGQFFLVLIGPVSYFLALISIVFLFVIYLRRLEPGNNFKTIAKKIFILSAIVLAITLSYNYLVLLKMEKRLLIFNIIGVIVFYVAGHLAALLVKEKYAPL